MAARNFPKTLYMKWEADGDDSFLVCAENPADHAIVNSKVHVGVYNLTASKTITANVEVA